MKSMLPLCLIIALSLPSWGAEQNSVKTAVRKTSKKSTPAKAEVKKNNKKNSPAKAKVKPPLKKEIVITWEMRHTAARKLMAAKKYSEAIKVFREAIALSKRQFQKNYSNYEIAACLTAQKKYDEAISLMRKKLPPRDLTSYHTARSAFICGDIYVLRKDYAKAEQEFRKAYDAAPVNWLKCDSLIRLGELCERSGDLSGALKYYRQIKDDTSMLSGNRCKGFMKTAEVLRKQKDFSSIPSLLDEASKLDQLPAQWHVKIAMFRYDLYMRSKKYREASDVLYKALRTPALDNICRAWLYSKLADHFRIRKNLYEARNWIRRAKAIRGASWGYDRKLHNRIDREIKKMERERKERNKNKRKNMKVQKKR